MTELQNGTNLPGTNLPDPNTYCLNKNCKYNKPNWFRDNSEVILLICIFVFCIVACIIFNDI